MTIWRNYGSPNKRPDRDHNDNHHNRNHNHNENNNTDTDTDTDHTRSNTGHTDSTNNTRNTQSRLSSGSAGSHATRRTRSRSRSRSRNSCGAPASKSKHAIHLSSSLSLAGAGSGAETAEERALSQPTAEAKTISSMEQDDGQVHRNETNRRRRQLPQLKQLQQLHLNLDSLTCRAGVDDGGDELLRRFGALQLRNVLSDDVAEALREHILNRAACEPVEDDVYIHSATQRRHLLLIPEGLQKAEADPREGDLDALSDPEAGASKNGSLRRPLSQALEQAMQSLRPILDPLLGPQATVVELATMISRPGAAAQPLHRDVGTRSPAIAARTVIVQLILQDTTAEMGSLTVVPGSHLDVLADDDEENQEENDAEQDEQKAGEDELAEEEKGTGERSVSENAARSLQSSWLAADGEEERCLGKKQNGRALKFEADAGWDWEDPARFQCCSSSPSRRRPRPKMAMAAPSGSALLFDGNILHHGGVHNDTKERVIAYLTLMEAKGRGRPSAQGSTFALAPALWGRCTAASLPYYCEDPSVQLWTFLPEELGCPLRQLSGILGDTTQLMRHLSRVENGNNIQVDLRPLLRAACKCGRRKVIELLLNRNACLDEVEDDHPPIHLAAEAGHATTVELLLTQRADVSMRDPSLRGGRATPLHVAAWRGHTAVAAALLHNRADLAARDGDEATPLHRAASSGSVEVVNFLLESRSYLEAQDLSGRSPLLVAAQTSQLAVLRRLLNLRASQLSCDNFGMSALHLAVAVEDLPSVAALLQACPTSTLRAPCLGEAVAQAVGIAKQCGHERVVEFLHSLPLWNIHTSPT